MGISQKKSGTFLWELPVYISIWYNCYPIFILFSLRVRISHPLMLSWSRAYFYFLRSFLLHIREKFFKITEIYIFEDRYGCSLCASRGLLSCTLAHQGLSFCINFFKISESQNDFTRCLFCRRPLVRSIFKIWTRIFLLLSRTSRKIEEKKISHVYLDMQIKVLTFCLFFFFF